VKTDIDITAVYPHPVERVWAALTSADALAAWLMPNDFQAAAGHRFTFRTKPAPGFDGIVRCEVLELDPPRRMVWSWAGGSATMKIDTTVTFTLTPTGPDSAHTRLNMRHLGFDGLGAQLTRRILAGGYPRILRQRLPAYLDRAAGTAEARSPGPAAPVSAAPAMPERAECAEGWRAYRNVFRRWREEALPAQRTPPGRAEPSHTTHGSSVPKEVHDGAHES
jgi:uncharacterized protein YndB with AHSA1/START domain